MYGTLDLYDRKSTDLISLQSIPSVHGTDRQKLNSATMSNRGFEISLGTVLPIKGEDIVWSGSVNYSYNKITELYKNFYFASELSRGVTEAYVKGYDANTLWSYRYAGMVNTGTVSPPSCSLLFTDRIMRNSPFRTFRPETDVNTCSTREPVWPRVHWG